MNINPPFDDLPFLAGGGEMGRLIREKDWVKTALGVPANWPLVLQHLVAQLLINPFPMLICWDEDFTQLYNDAFRPINGATKHPQALGGSARDTYAEIWDTIGPMFTGVMQGMPVSFPNFMVPLERNGYTEDCYFDFAYSPIRDEQGLVQGVMVICVETTEKIRALNDLEANQKNIKNMIRQAPVGICLVSGSPLYVEQVNDLFLEIIGKKREAFRHTPYWEVIEEARSIYEPITDHVMQTGEIYRAKEHEILLIRKGVPEMVFVDFVYEPMRDADNNIIAIIIVATEVTDKVLARKVVQEINEEMAAANEELSAMNEEQASSNEELTQSQDAMQELYGSLQASEAKMDQIIEQLPASISVITGYDLIVERTNASNLNYWQKQREEVIGKPLLEILPELKDQAFPGQLRGVMENGEMIVQYEWPVHLTTSDGQVQTTYVDYSYQAITDQEGHRIGVLVMSNDVTAQVEARRKLEQSEFELQQANLELAQSRNDLLFTIDAAGLGTFDLNPLTGRFTGNELLKSWFGLRPEEEIPLEAATNVIAEADRQRVIAAIQVALDFNSGGNYDVEYAINNPSAAEPLIVRAKGKAVFNDEKQAIRLSGTLQDITEQKKDDQRKNDFIGMVSHELKTPLTSLTAIVQLANVKLKNSSDKFLAGAMEKASVQVKRMTTMINGFLNVSRLESGKLQIDKKEFLLDDMLHEIIGEMELTTADTAFHFDACAPVTIYADREKIASVVANLLSNAIKYGAKSKVIDIRCSVRDGKAVVSIQDYGMGIKRQDREKLFDRYYRVENNNTQHISGFGIGLYLSAEIIHRHEGQIWVESDYGFGSTFYFSLPLNVI